MTTTVLQVEGMACEHCVKTVTKAVRALPGVRTVQVDLQGKTVTVAHDAEEVTQTQIQEAIEQQGYDVVA